MVTAVMVSGWYQCWCVSPSKNRNTGKVNHFLCGAHDCSCSLITKWNRVMIYGAIRGTGWN